ncbi:hypothetical protein PNOK_0044300 [Pyrrhoderma noxium]|uniref:Uncharacterized protein n=1 Tax=Pyrrhoderma noxium TaxID=2282107 RepID=A0A286UVA2_9AGAM|nr:hypothetical protein PNOK_0044300 [Pyrrhoderma noxium]
MGPEMDIVTSGSEGRGRGAVREYGMSNVRCIRDTEVRDIRLSLSKLQLELELDFDFDSTGQDSTGLESTGLGGNQWAGRDETGRD